MKRKLFITVFAAVATALVSGCAQDSAPIRRQVSRAGKSYVIVITPSHLTKAAHDTYASLFMHGFETGLRGQFPLIHFNPSLDRAIRRGWSDGHDQGLREYARYHWRDVRERLPGFYDRLKSEGFKPVSQ